MTRPARGQRRRTRRKGGLTGDPAMALDFLAGCAGGKEAAGSGAGWEAGSPAGPGPRRPTLGSGFRRLQNGGDSALVSRGSRGRELTTGPEGVQHAVRGGTRRSNPSRHVQTRGPGRRGSTVACKAGTPSRMPHRPMRASSPRPPAHLSHRLLHPQPAPTRTRVPSQGRRSLGLAAPSSPADAWAGLGPQDDPLEGWPWRVLKGAVPTPGAESRFGTPRLPTPLGELLGGDSTQVAAWA